MGLAVLRQREPQRFLGAGLADRAGDADHLGPRARARRGGKIAQTPQARRGTTSSGASFRKLRAPVGGDHGKAGLGGKRGGDELVAVAAIPNGEKGFAGRNRAAVDGNSGDRLRQRAVPLGAHRRRHRVDGPQRTRVMRQAP